MADDELIERKDTTERRVYTLPAPLLERLRAYQVSQGIASEAEAARRLLDSALQMRDDIGNILTTLQQKFSEEKDLRILAAEVLAKHALVNLVIIDDDEVIFRIKNGERGRVTWDGRLFCQHPEQVDDDWSAYGRKSEKTAPVKKAVTWDAPKDNNDLDDEIPF